MTIFNKWVLSKFGSKRGFFNSILFRLLDVFLMRYRSNKGLPDKIKRVVFVCKGNICRSASAEAFFKLRSSISCVSIGLDTTSGCAADERTEGLVTKYHASLSDHVTTSIRDFVPMDGDVYFCMEPGHLPGLMARIEKAPALLLGVMVALVVCISTTRSTLMMSMLRVAWIIYMTQFTVWFVRLS